MQPQLSYLEKSESDDESEWSSKNLFDDSDDDNLDETYNTVQKQLETAREFGREEQIADCEKKLQELNTQMMEQEMEDFNDEDIVQSFGDDGEYGNYESYDNPDKTQIELDYDNKFSMYYSQPTNDYRPSYATPSYYSSLYNGTNMSHPLSSYTSKYLQPQSLEKSEFEKNDFKTVKYKTIIIITDSIYVDPPSEKLIKINNDKIRKFDIPEDCILIPSFKKKHKTTYYPYTNFNKYHQSNIINAGGGNIHTEVPSGVSSDSLTDDNKYSKWALQVRNTQTTTKKVDIDLKLGNILGLILDNDLFPKSKINIQRFVLEITSLIKTDTDLHTIIRSNHGIAPYQPPKIYEIYKIAKKAEYIELKMYCIIQILENLSNGKIIDLFKSNLDHVDIDNIYLLYLFEYEVTNYDILCLYDESLLMDTDDTGLKLLEKHLNFEIFNDERIIDNIIITKKNSLYLVQEKCFEWLFKENLRYFRIINSTGFKSLGETDKKFIESKYHEYSSLGKSKIKNNNTCFPVLAKASLIPTGSSRDSIESLKQRDLRYLI